MNYPEDFFNSDYNSLNDNEGLKHKVQTCKEYVSSGQIFDYLENIEETIQLCIEYDFVEDGIYLVDAALEIVPYNSDLWYSKGIFHSNLFEFEKALECFNKAISLNPSDSDILISKSIAEENLGMIDDAVESLQNSILFDPENEEALFGLATLYERQENFEKAIEYFKKALDVESEFSEAWYELGYSYENLNRLEEALEAYEKYISIEPYNPTGWYNKGIVLMRMNNFEKAIDSFEITTAIDENFVGAWFNTGVAYANLNRLNDALEAFLKASKLDPLDEATWLNLAKVSEDLGNISEAISYYDKINSLNDTYTEAFLGRGVCYLKLGMQSYAANDLNKAVLLSFNIKKFWRHEDEKWLLKAFKEILIFKKKTAADEYNFENWFTLASNYLQIGNWFDAFRSFQKCIELKSDSADSYYNKAIAAFYLQKTEDALKSLKSAFALNPELKETFEEDFPEISKTELFLSLFEYYNF